MLRAALGHLASVDSAALTIEEHARCLRVLEQSNADRCRCPDPGPRAIAAAGDMPKT